MNLHSISQLYANVLKREIAKKRIPEREICKGIQSMAHAYAPDPTNFESTVLQLPNYNDPACRVAYLHKFAPLHTYIVLDAMLKILQARPDLFRDLCNSSEFKFCSLGGGPGSDVIGVLTVLRAVFGAFCASITVIDCMKKWEETFSSVLCELTLGSYGKKWNINLCDCRLSFHYIGFNLLSTMTSEISETIANASLLTMIKFVSAAACTDTEEMVDTIFRVMKPGALVLYIDNAAGGFTQVVQRSSERNGIVAVYGPHCHVTYEAEALKNERFGYQSCYKTTVTIILLQKMMSHQLIQWNVSLDTNFSNPSVFVPTTQHEPVNFNVLKNSASKRAHMGSSIRVPELAKTVSSDGKAAKALSNVAVDQNSFGAKKSNNITTVLPNKVGAKNISGSSFKQNKTGAKNISSLPQAPVQDSASKRAHMDSSVVPDLAKPVSSDGKAADIASKRALMDNSVIFPKLAKTVSSFGKGANSESMRAEIDSSVLFPELPKTVSSDGKAAKANSNVAVDQNNAGVKKNNNVPTLGPNKVGVNNISGSSFKQNKTGTESNSSLSLAPKHSASIRVPPTTVNNLRRYVQVPSSEDEPRTIVSNTVRCTQPTSSTIADNYWPETNDNAGDTCCACCVIS